MIPEWELTFAIPNLAKTSLSLRTRLRETVVRDLSYCELKVILSSMCRLLPFYSRKKKIRSWIIYCYTCSKYKVTLYGKIFSHFYVRADEHTRISILTGKRLKSVKRFAISLTTSQWKHLCQFAIDSKSKFGVESFSRFHRF